MRDAFGVDHGDISKGLETKYRKFMFDLEDKRSQKRWKAYAKKVDYGMGFDGSPQRYNSPKQIERHQRRYEALRASQAKDKLRLKAKEKK